MTGQALKRAVCVLVSCTLGVSAQETKDQAAALALLAKIDGKIKFDPAHPKRVISIDI